MAAARIARNTTYVTIASMLQKVISFVYFGYLADSIGGEQLGKYSFALAFTSVAIIFMDFGLGPLLTREIAKDEDSLQQQFNQFFSIKLWLMVIVLVVLFPVAFFSDMVFATVDHVDVVLISIGAAIIVFDTLTFTLFSLFRARKQLLWEAIGIVLYQTTILLFGGFALWKNLPLPVVLSALLVGSALQFFYLFIVARIRLQLRFHYTFKWSLAKRLLQLAAPFAIAGIIFRLNGTADQLMLKIMSGDSYAGWYNLAFKLSFALTVLPGAFVTSYYPAVSYYFIHAKDKLHGAFENGIIYMVLLSLPVVAGVAVLGDNIILRIWGIDFEASIQPLWILMTALPFVFLNYPVGNFLNAVNKQKVNTLNMLIALAINVGLNAWLIPLYTFNGAAIASSVSSIVLVLLGLPWVYRIAPFRFGVIFSKTLRIAVAAAVMAGVVYMVELRFSLLVLIAIGAFIYGAAALIFGAVTRAELRSFAQAVLKR